MPEGGRGLAGGFQNGLLGRVRVVAMGAREARSGRPRRRKQTPPDGPLLRHWVIATAGDSEGRVPAAGQWRSRQGGRVCGGGGVRGQAGGATRAGPRAGAGRHTCTARALGRAQALSRTALAPVARKLKGDPVAAPEREAVETAQPPDNAGGLTLTRPRNEMTGRHRLGIGSSSRSCRCCWRRRLWRRVRGIGPWRGELGGTANVVRPRRAGGAGRRLVGRGGACVPVDMPARLCVRTHTDVTQPKRSGA